VGCGACSFRPSGILSPVGLHGMQSV